jgi:hypothetical protein
MVTYWVEISLGIDWLDDVADDDDLCRLSERQYKRAINVQQGDIILHHVNGARCWAGYSEVIEQARKTPNPQTEGDKAYPFSLRIKAVKWLTTGEEFFRTRSKTIGLSHDNWHRKGYVQVNNTDAARIMEAIDNAIGTKIGIDDADFKEKLLVLRNANASKLCKMTAGYECRLCKNTLKTWCDSLPVELLPYLVCDPDPGWFVDAHHIKPVAGRGNADLDNLLCVCPNCHRLLRGLDETGVKDLLGKLRGMALDVGDKKETASIEEYISQLKPVEIKPHSIDDSLNYIIDSDVRSLFLMTMDSIRKLGDDVEEKADHNGLTYWVAGHKIGDLNPKKKYFAGDVKVSPGVKNSKWHPTISKITTQEKANELVTAFKTAYQLMKSCQILGD